MKRFSKVTACLGRYWHPHEIYTRDQRMKLEAKELWTYLLGVASYNGGRLR